MTDIVERLRDRDATVGAGLFHCIPTMAAAADEIERLREQVKLAAVAVERTTANHRDVVETKRRTDERLRVALTALQQLYLECEDEEARKLAGDAFNQATVEVPRSSPVTAPGSIPDLTTNPDLLALIERAKHHKMTPEEAYAQRRSFVRGMCPSNRDYAEWCAAVDQHLPPLPSTESQGEAG